MALPLLAAVPFVGSIVTGIGTLSTMVATWIVAKLTAKAFFLGSQIFVSFLLITSHIALLAFFLYAIMFVYNQYNTFLSLISTFGGGNEILSIAFQVIQSLGVLDAFTDVFAIFSPFILGYLGYKASMLVFHSLEHTSNELFKVGVLVQQ